jgi:penicillin-insensitive murein DD-endopeptidase
LPIADLTATTAPCQDTGSVDPKPLPNPNDPKLGAKELFGCKTSPAPLATHSIGCLAGAQALPINSETWQIMRLSRNRNSANCLVGH